MHRMPVSTSAQTGWYCCVQTSGRGSLQVTRPAAGAGGGVAGSGARAAVGAVAGAAFRGGEAVASPAAPPEGRGRVVEHAANEMNASQSPPHDLFDTGSA